MTDRIETTVIAALEDKRYKWRTIKGIAKQTNHSEDIVKHAIRKLAETGVVVQSSVSGKDGQELFTTRSHFRKRSRIMSRFAAILRNRGT